MKKLNHLLSIEPGRDYPNPNVREVGPVTVYTFTNSPMVMVFDEAGEQMPAYQGRLTDVEAKIRRDFPDAVWKEPFDFRAALDATPPEERWVEP